MSESLLSDGEYITAATVASLLADMRTWVHRRVEQAEILDDVSVRRRVSIDLTVPRSIDDIDVAEGLCVGDDSFVPLTFLKKERLRAFDLRAADGMPVPMLSRRDNGALATNVLISQAEAILQTRLPVEMREPLHVVAEGPEPHARAAFAAWSRHAEDSRNPDQAAWSELVNRQGFLELGEALVADFVVCAVADPAPGKRQIFKLSYEEPFGEDTRHFLAWRWKVLSIEAPQAKLADSYHLEVMAPTDMQLDAAWLTFDGPEPSLADARGDFDFPKSSRSHLYVSQVPRDLTAKAYLYLRMRAQGNLRAAVFASALCTTLLWLLYAVLDTASDPQHNQITAGVLLLGPTLLTAAVVRPGEHRLLTNMFFWVRALAVLSLGCCLAAASSLAGVGGSGGDVVWLGSAIVSSVATAGLFGALMSPQRL
ncbi:hypothetical protein [Conexibacter woesei]|uniref:hypothetical protein n=1 Tax=Conexibacter woesei TaxID=191495 RepID=UPI0004154ECF|nr:hypothetical protein [Conexibacter woesei]